MQRAAVLEPWLLPGRRREVSERGRVWTGRREKVINQLLKAGAEVDMLW